MLNHNEEYYNILSGEVVMYKINVLNNISAKGLEILTEQGCDLNDHTQPEGIILRSHSMHDMVIPDSLLAVARAGAGVNNIPVAKLADLGIPVFNTPGANANAVKELILAGMLLACRNIPQAWEFLKSLSGDNEAIHKAVESKKKQFSGFELPGKTLAVIGLGAIGVEVANAAAALGMRVLGYDPAVTVQRAWQLSASVRQASTIEAAVAKADFITIHVPYNDKTKHLINAKILSAMNSQAILLNFSRAEIVEESALLTALTQENLQTYVCDFPSLDLLNHPQVMCLPHLGASTREAEENCAIMAATSLCDYLQNGHIKHSVNFPDVNMPHNGHCRLAIANSNQPNMVGQISTALAQADLNIVDMINKSRADVAYTLLDIDRAVPAQVLKVIEKIEGVLKLRMIKADG
ncbi:MAG: phosphoglycerate dehydrogenase [Gammaproteobacteria bacterium]